MQRMPRWHARLVALSVLAPCILVLGLAAWLKPDPSGVGTHTQLGLPACGMLISSHVPCPTCGMTTAFSLAAHGRLLASLAAQPAGAVFALGVAAMALLSGWALLRGLDMTAWGQRLLAPSVLVSAGALVGAAWVYKILAIQGIFS